MPIDKEKHLTNLRKLPHEIEVQLAGFDQDFVALFDPPGLAPLSY